MNSEHTIPNMQCIQTFIENPCLKYHHDNNGFFFFCYFTESIFHEKIVGNKYEIELSSIERNAFAQNCAFVIDSFSIITLELVVGLQ